MTTRNPLPDATSPAPPAGPKAAPGAGVAAPWLVLLAAPLAASANGPVLILPDIGRSLGVSPTTASLLVTVFAWAVAVGTPLTAALVRRRGLRVALRASTALLVAGSATLALAPWLPLLIVGRAAQALGGAGLVAVAMNLAGSVRRMGAISAGFGVFGAVGPLAGSLLSDTLSWRAALLATLLSLIAVPVVARRLPAHSDADGTPFDARGALLLTFVVTALVVLPHHPGLAATAAGIGIAALVAHVRTRPEGFLPAHLLRTPAFLIAAPLAGALATSYFAMLFAVPRLLADRTDWSTDRIGILQMAALLAGAATSWTMASLSARTGRRTTLTVALVLGAAAPLAAVLASGAPPLLLVTAAATAAATLGNAALGVMAADSTTTARRPAAIGLVNLCYQLGGAFGPVLALLAVAP
ncbi:MFS transporter [Streptomyces sp. NPDC058646]|uniref:MFS transporter n=1 Tax=Streptomyces sp. NPDC058646 TaxID=3346574 RepID=UPI003667B463